MRLVDLQLLSGHLMPAVALGSLVSIPAELLEQCRLSGQFFKCGHNRCGVLGWHQERIMAVADHIDGTRNPGDDWYQPTRHRFEQRQRPPFHKSWKEVHLVARQYLREPAVRIVRHHGNPVMQGRVVVSKYAGGLAPCSKKGDRPSGVLRQHTVERLGRECNALPIYI